METDAAVDKVSDLKSCPQRLGKTYWLSHSFHRPDDGQPTNNKTGQITCYKNRTFSFATDTPRGKRRQTADDADELETIRAIRFYPRHPRLLHDFQARIHYAKRMRHNGH